MDQRWNILPIKEHGVWEQVTNAKGAFWIEGEIEGMKSQPHSTGHYFSLIDGEGKDKAKL